MISLYLQLFLLTCEVYCSEAWFFIVPGRSKYQTRCYFYYLATGRCPALLLDQLPCRFPYTCMSYLFSFILPVLPLSSWREFCLCSSSAVVLSTGVESRKVFLAVLHLCPDKHLSDGGKVAKVAAAGRKYRSWSTGRRKER